MFHTVITSRTKVLERFESTGNRMLLRRWANAGESVCSKQIVSLMWPVAAYCNASLTTLNSENNNTVKKRNERISGREEHALNETYDNGVGSSSRRAFASCSSINIPETLARLLVVFCYGGAWTTRDSVSIVQKKIKRGTRCSTSPLKL